MTSAPDRDAGPTAAEVVATIENGVAIRLRDLPGSSVPPTTGIYTFWLDDEFLYVGISYRDPATTSNPQAKGILGRLRTYYQGRRTHDLSLAICDRYIVPDLTAEQVAGLRTGATNLNELTRTFMHEKLTIRWCSCPGNTARAIEAQVRSSGLPQGGLPLLNPQSRPSRRERQR